MSSEPQTMSEDDVRFVLAAMDVDYDEFVVLYDEMAEDPTAPDDLTMGDAVVEVAKVHTCQSIASQTGLSVDEVYDLMFVNDDGEPKDAMLNIKYDGVEETVTINWNFDQEGE